MRHSCVGASFVFIVIFGIVRASWLEQLGYAIASGIGTFIFIILVNEIDQRSRFNAAEDLRGSTERAIADSDQKDARARSNYLLFHICDALPAGATADIERNSIASDGARHDQQPSDEGSALDDSRRRAADSSHD